jgi:SAM-dependent methyltransferase
VSETHNETRTQPDSLRTWSEFGDHMGTAYLRYSFTKGTVQEVGFLWEQLRLQPGVRVLDVGCGPGRHAVEFARRGAVVTGLDISPRFVELGNDAARREGLAAQFIVGDARQLPFEQEFDVVVSLCQGGFGLLGRSQDGSTDATVLHEMARVLRPGGSLVLSAFSAYFQLRYLEPSDSFDAATAVNTEQTELRDENGLARAAELHTTCFTPLELRLLLERCGLVICHLWSVAPGRYASQPPSVDQPEWLVLAERPGAWPV